MANQPLKSKVVSGSTKKRSSSKLTKRTALFALTGILAFSTIAGIGWQKWQDHQLKAKAAGWTTVFDGFGVKTVACKTAVDSGYGPLWKVSLYFIGNGTQAAVGGFNILRGSSKVSSIADTVYPGQWHYRETYASRTLGDTWLATGGTNSMGGGSGVQSFANITGC